MLNNDSPVLKVSLKLTNQILKTNLTSLEVLRVAGNPNLVFYEMWLLTIDPVRETETS